MRLIRAISIASALLLATVNMAAAQTGAFDAGTTDLGPVVGLGGIGGAGISIGGRLDHGIKRLPNLGNGVLSIAASVDHYSYDDFGFGFSYTPIAVTANYHFHLDNEQWDPFFGLGLGDYIVSEPDNCHGCSFNSGIYFVGRLGIRYYWKPKLALYADVGAGAGALHVGVMFKLSK